MFRICLLCSLLISCLIEANISPKLEEFKPKRSQNSGTKFKIFCSLQEGSKPLQFEWQKNGRILHSTDPIYRIETTEDDSVLVVDKLSSSDSSNYSCSVRNHFGSDSQFTVLTVKGLQLLRMALILSRHVAHIESGMATIICFACRH